MDRYFYNKTKAEVLSDLSKKKLKFAIPITFYFKVEEWNYDKKNILRNIFKTFKKKKFVAIRSSAIEEDNENLSNAGKFSSELKIPLIKNNLILSISRIIKDYKKVGKKKYHLKNQILIQEMITNTSMSGVIFTKERETGAYYYSINYDDITGLTNTVTSGVGKYSNKTLFIYRTTNKQLRSPRFRKLIIAVKDLEKKIQSDNLDIEFCVTKNLIPYLLQVRKITLNNTLDKLVSYKLDTKLKNIEKKILPKFKKDKNIHGKSTIFGQMPDWNPIEIIGKHPNKLAYSLYTELITKKVWAKARKIMGYKNLSNYNLMTNFGGQPYIDVRLSFNSFLPNNLEKKISEKIINHSIEKLKLNPMYHDKIEFDIAITNYDFDFEKKLNKLYGDILNKNEKKIFKSKIKKLTVHNLDLTKSSNLKKALLSIEKLKLIQSSKKKYTIYDLKKIISECKKYGTMPFSILARHAFIATDLIKSLLNKKILNKKDVENFQSSIFSITSEMLDDTRKMTKRSFLKKYGHLRPGTYDIKSTRYDKLKKFNIVKKPQIKKRKKFILDNGKKLKIEKLIKKNNLNLNSAEELFEYIRVSIVSREYAKFIFTKSVSLILEIISSYGKKSKINKDILSNISIYNFLDKKILRKKKKLLSISKKNELEHSFSKSIKLPQLIHDVAGVKVIPFQVSFPNFITRKKVQGEKVFLDSKNFNLKIKNKIIMIENADPGFDWIFGNKILGLITKYGGVNSHMAIRCAELEIPAAIGCGEQKFETLKNFDVICLDSAASNIYNI
tara:strand:+ start:15120 stop:17465 length:2346 start_codon:yes stop_codon:yes gene_type:complete